MWFMECRYNCTNTYEYDSRSNENDLTTVSKERLQDKCYVGSNEFGSFTICPFANVTIQKDNNGVSIRSVSSQVAERVSY